MGRFGSVVVTSFVAGPSTAAPFGMALGLPPVFAVLAVVIGSAVSFVVALFAMDWLKSKWPKRKNKKGPGKAVDRARRLLNRLGPAGLGLLGPALIGTWVSAAVGSAFGLARWPLLVWLMTGAIVWSAVLVAASGTLLNWIFG
jgi:hypothetical protein